jgi:hypothetical protein
MIQKAFAKRGLSGTRERFVSGTVFFMSNLLAKAQVTQEILEARTLNKTLMKHIQNNQKSIGKFVPAYGF